MIQNILPGFTHGFTSLCNGFHRSVSRKLALYIIGSGILVALLAVLIRVFVNYTQWVPELEHSVTQTLRTHAPHLQKSLNVGNSREIQGILESIASHPEILALSITWTAPNQRQYRFSHPKQALLENAILVDLNTPNLTTHVQLNNELVFQKIQTLIYENLILIVVQAIVISGLLLFYMETIFARHLRAIARYAKELQLNNLTQQFHYPRATHTKHPPDELDDVAIAINNMRIQLLNDIQEKDAIERALQKEKEETQRTQRKILAAEEANRAKSQFIATLSHEIRTPLNGILGMVELLGHSDLQNNQKRCVNIAKQSGQSLMAVINDILDYSKIEANKMVLNPEPFDLDEVLDECAQLFSAITSKKNIMLYTAIAPDTPCALVGDSGRLKQILLNLLGNAFKFTEHGYIHLHVSSAATSCATAPKLIFAVTDTGIGISKQAQKQLFQAFTQADSSTSRKFGGSGLGLTISKALVDLMNGDMGVQSAPNAGAKFWFTAQFAPGATPNKNPIEHPLPRSLLCISSNSIFQETLAQYAKSWQVKFLSVSNLEQAQDYLPKVSACLIESECIHAQPQAFDQLVANKQLQILVFTQPLETLEQADIECLPHPITRKALAKKLRVASTPFGAPSTQAASAQASPIEGQHFLVAEDNSVNRLVVEGLLSQLGATAEFAHNGQDALACYLQSHASDSTAQTGEACEPPPRPFDAILMDCEMPLMDGYEATRAIRAWEQENGREPIPIIALTAHVETQHKHQVFASGMNAYLSKPVSLDHLRDALCRPKPLETKTSNPGSDNHSKFLAETT